MKPRLPLTMAMQPMTNQTCMLQSNNQSQNLVGIESGVTIVGN